VTAFLDLGNRGWKSFEYVLQRAYLHCHEKIVKGNPVENSEGGERCRESLILLNVFRMLVEIG
jgi:hypothetical protein